MRINYVVACYVGMRRNEILDPYEYIRTHLVLLDRFADHSIAKISVVLSVDGDEGDSFINFCTNIIEASDYLRNRVDIRLRPNRGFSYAAWHEEILASMNDFDYFFLVEDDYAPGYSKFYEPFLEQLQNRNIGYCCSKVSFTHGRHAGMSSGMMRADVARIVVDKFGAAFLIDPNTTQYGVGEWSQIHFLDLMEQAGFTFNDPSHLVSTPFLDIFKNIMDHGNPKGPCPLKPILGVIE